MTEIPISDSQRRMGRPPLSKKFETTAVLVRLASDMLKQIDELAGDNRRAQFIREAIEREIKRRSRKASEAE